MQHFRVRGFLALPRTIRALHNAAAECGTIIIASLAPAPDGGAHVRVQRWLCVFVRQHRDDAETLPHCLGGCWCSRKNYIKFKTQVKVFVRARARALRLRVY